MEIQEDQVRALIQQEAADWFVANSQGLDETERRRFIGWLRSSPLHMEEYLAAASIANQIPGARLAAGGSVESLLALAQQAEVAQAFTIAPRLPRKRAAVPMWRWIAAGAAVALVMVVVGIAHRWHSGAIGPAQSTDSISVALHTSHGQIMTQALEDRTVVTLDTDSAVSVRYTPRARVARLTAGRVHFGVTHESARGFAVVAGGAVIHAVGTSFDVRLDGESVEVTLYEGSLRVDRDVSDADQGAPPREDAVLLSPGQQLRIEPGHWPTSPQRQDLQHTGAWQHGQLVFKHRTLEQAAAEFNRYSTRTIRVENPRLRTLEINGVFRADDLNAFIAFLRSLEGAQVEVTSTDVYVR